MPFCLRGGAAWLRGRGEQLETVTLDGPLPVVVALPPLHLATEAVYEAWDELGGPIAQRRVPAPRAVAPLLAVEELSNDLELAAERVEPRLADFRADLEAAADAPAIMAGSGSAYAVLLDADTAAEATAPGPPAQPPAEGAGRGHPRHDPRGPALRLTRERRRPPRRAAVVGYRPCWRRCQRVFFNSFLCFFLRMRLRRFLISEPMTERTVPGVSRRVTSSPGACSAATVRSDAGARR